MAYRAKFGRKAGVGAVTPPAFDPSAPAETLSDGIEMWELPFSPRPETVERVSSDGYWEWSDAREEWQPTAAFLEEFGPDTFSPDGYWEWSEARQQWLPTRALLDEMNDLGPLLLSPDGKWAWSDRRQEWLSARSLREVLGELDASLLSSDGAWEWSAAREEWAPANARTEETAPEQISLFETTETPGPGHQGEREPETAASARLDSADTARPVRVQRRHRIIAALVAAMLVLGFVAIVVPRGTSSSVALDPVGGTLRWPRRAFANGVTIDERWSLRGPNGTKFESVITLTNPKAHSLVVEHDAVIPKSVAASASLIRFKPQPLLIKDDPVVRWSAQLPPTYSGQLEYRVDVKADEGSTPRQRLEGWYDDAVAAIAEYEDSTGLTAPTQVEPRAEPEIREDPPPAAAPRSQTPGTTRSAGSGTAAGGGGGSGGGTGTFSPPLSLPPGATVPPPTVPPPTTVPPTTPPTVPPTEPPTVPPTIAPTDPPTVPPTEPPTVPPTEPPTVPPTEPPTVPPTEPPTVPPTEPPTVPPTEPPIEPPTVPPTDPPVLP